MDKDGSIAFSYIFLNSDNWKNLTKLSSNKPKNVTDLGVIMQETDLILNPCHTITHKLCGPEPFQASVSTSVSFNINNTYPKWGV